MDGKANAKKVARIYLDRKYESDRLMIQKMMNIAWQEYQKRIESIQHYEPKNRGESSNRIALQIGKEFGFDAERRMLAVEWKDSGEIVEEPHLILGINTEYLYFQTINGKDIASELNKNAEVLIGLIYAIISGGY